MLNFVDHIVTGVVIFIDNSGLQWYNQYICMYIFGLFLKRKGN